MSTIDALPARARVADDVFERLREAILERRLEPGSRLSVPDIASRLGVSRSPVREAVQRLAQEGLAIESPHRGATVASLDPRTIADIYETREVLEGLAAARAARQRTAADMKALRRQFEQHRDSVAIGDDRSLIKLDLAFHRLIRTIAGNDYLDVLLQRIEAKVIIGMLSGDVNLWPKKAVMEHKRILDAIDRSDEVAAEAAARDHVRRIRTALAERAALTP